MVFGRWSGYALAVGLGFAAVTRRPILRPRPLPALLSGAIIIERIFAWPRMGQLFFNSITERDYPVIMGLVLMFSILTLAGQLLADVLYALVDPRVRLS